MEQQIVEELKQEISLLQAEIETLKAKKSIAECIRESFAQERPVRVLKRKVRHRAIGSKNPPQVEITILESDYKEIFGTALLYNQTLGFEDVYKRMFDNIFNPILERFQYTPSNRQYVMMYYLNGVNAIILEWLRNGCDKSIQEIAEIISICIYGKDNTNR